MHQPRVDLLAQRDPGDLKSAWQIAQQGHVLISTLIACSNQKSLAKSLEYIFLFGWYSRKEWTSEKGYAIDSENITKYIMINCLEM